MPKRSKVEWESIGIGEEFADRSGNTWVKIDEKSYGWGDARFPASDFACGKRPDALYQVRE